MCSVPRISKIITSVYIVRKVRTFNSVEACVCTLKKYIYILFESFDNIEVPATFASIILLFALQDA